MRAFLAATMLCALSFVASLSPAQARQAEDRVDSLYTGHGYVAGPAQAVRTERARRFQSKAEYRAWRRANRGARHARVAEREFRNAKQVVGTGGSAPHYVAEAQRWLGYRPSLPELKQWGDVTGARWTLNRVRLHCALGLNYVLARAGLPTTRSNLARSFFDYGTRANGPAVGTIFVQRRHVAMVVGISARGNPLVLGFNQGRGVTTILERHARSGAYRWPPGTHG